MVGSFLSLEISPPVNGSVHSEMLSNILNLIGEDSDTELSASATFNLIARSPIENCLEKEFLVSFEFMVSFNTPSTSEIHVNIYGGTPLVAVPSNLTCSEGVKQLLECGEAILAYSVVLST